MSERVNAGRVAITGAGGFIGRTVAARLSRAGYSLLLISPRDHAELHALPRAEVAIGRAGAVLAERGLKGLAGLVHLASSTNPRVGDFGDELAQLSELERMVARAHEAPGLRLVFCSSGGTVYRDTHVPHVEDEPLEPATPYGWGKTAAEGLLLAAARAGSFSPSILRCANVYGPRQVVRRQGLIMLLLRDLLEGRTSELWGDGLETRDYVFVDDVADLVELVLSDGADPSGVFNVGAGVAHSIRDVVEAVEAATGRTPSVRWAPELRSAVRSNVLDCARAQRRFGWRATTPLVEGIRRTFESL